MGHHPSALRGAVEALVEAGYGVESVLVLARRQGDDAVVSIGVDRPVSRGDWKLLGGIDDDDELPPAELTAI